ncbi:hypothetical protein [Proteus hauseri]|uniref:hypothetical protein n=1 Tax=Proteus hauseri TaxID=183417 RepID=UPI001009415F|nr:hypothetical protein [Proteus hauseri]QAV24550.1 hypothetical protein PH4a_14905 [Proteus hauseri]
MKTYLMIFAMLYSSALLAENKTDMLATENKYCSSPKQTMDEIYENGARTYCVYQGMSLLDAYKKYINEHDEEYLEKTLKLNVNREKEYADGSISVVYKWESPRRLVIEQQFSGGSTDFLFEENKAGTKITITGYPD